MGATIVEEIKSKVTIIVIDKSSQTPIKDAEVSFADEVKLTDEQGIAFFEGYEPGQYNYSVTIQGFTEKEGTIEIIESDVTEKISMQTTGINDIDLSGLKVYPNPAHNIINVESSSLHINCIQLVDCKGRILYRTQKVKSKHEINISDFKSGVYILRITTNESVYTKEIIKR